jgi:zinc protease
VQFSYEFNGGYSTDLGAKPGLASFTMGLLDEGAGGVGSLEFANKAEALGASIGSGASLDGGSAYLSALKENLDPSLALFADMLRRPNFEPAEIDRIKASWIAGIRQEKARPQGIAARIAPALLFGADHPYGAPSTGSGDEAAIASMTRDDLVAFHRRWVRPEGATLIVVGDTTLAEIVPMLEKHLGDWRGQGEPAPAMDVAEVALPGAPRVFLVDQPGAVQANIYAMQLVPSTTSPNATRFDMANGVIGGDFTARLNMNLREDKHWSYGARSSTNGALGQRRWSASAPVQIDKTAESVAEMQREIAEFASGQRPPSDAEVERVKAIQTLSLPGAYETAASVMSTIGGIVRYGRPDDYVFRRKAEVEAMSTAQVAEAARTLVPEALTWVVVGDLSQIDAPVRALQLGRVQVLDADGNPVAE